MPKKLEMALKREAKKRFGSVKSEKARAFIYGTMRRQGWKPKREQKKKKLKLTSKKSGK